MNQESLRIILKTFSKGEFSEDEVVQLIEDLYRYRTSYVPSWPQITYETEPFKKFEITCKQ